MSINKDLKFPANIHDSLLQSITIDDLITTTNCNELYMNKETVERVFNELLQDNIKQARELLRANMSFILSNLENK